jgi:hypothetical protein
VAKGDGDRAEELVRSHLTKAPGFMVARLRLTRQEIDV